MKKVFVITSGSYSDYSIVGAFSTKAKAQRALDTLSIYGKNEYIEEYELDKLDDLVDKLDDLVDKFARGYSVYWVNMKRDGLVEDVHKDDSVDTWLNHNKNKGMIWGQVLAKSDEHAVKIVNEKRAQLIASGEL